MNEWLSKFWENLKKWLTEFFNANPVPNMGNANNPVSTPKSPRILEKGMQGEDVKAMQAKLHDLGYSLDVDGEFGNKTYAAVIAFQADNSIGKTGKVGPQTAAALAEAKLPTSVNAAMLKAADIAEAEGKKKLVWTGLSSEAEKYLESIRSAVGVVYDRFPWCGAFVYWCCKQAGANIPAAFPTGYTVAYCPGWEAWAVKNKTWHFASDKTFNPKRGDIVLYNWDGDEYADHIGIVLDYKPGSNTITAAEGNTGTNETNGNSTAVKVREWYRIKGFIRLGSA